MTIFYSLKDYHHQVGMDNLYNSADFSDPPTTMIVKYYATAWLARLVEAFLNAYSKTRRIILLYSDQHGLPSRQLF